MDSPFSLFGPMRSAIETAKARTEELKQRRSIAAAPETGKTGMDVLRDIAIETGIPRNVLVSIIEASGAKTPEEALSAASNAANRLSGPVRAGKSYEDALKEVTGDDKLASAILGRAYQLADELDPAGAADAGRPEEAGWGGIRDTLGQVLDSTLGGLGRGAVAVGEQLDQAINVPMDVLINRPLRAVTGYEIPRSGGGRLIGEGADWALSGLGDAADRNMVSRERQIETQDLVEGIGGNILDPSTWSVDTSKITGGGLAGVGAQLFGSMLPAIVSRNPAVAVGTGYGMAAGEGADNAASVLDQMAATVTKDGASTQLYDESAVYRGLIDGGMSHAEALAETKSRARLFAGEAQGVIGGLGGLLTQKIVRGGEHLASGLASRTGRSIGGALTSGLEEGVQETAEGMASQAGLNLGAGTNESVTDGSLANFMLGAMGGGAVGGAAGALSRQRSIKDGPVDDMGLPLSPATPALPAPTSGGTVIPPGLPGQPSTDFERDPTLPTAPRGLKAATQPANFRQQGPAPTGLPAPAPMAAAPDVAPIEPIGPLGRAAQAAPAPITSPDLLGQEVQIRLMDQPNAPIYAVIEREDAMGLHVMDTVTDQQFTIPREELESGAVRIEPVQDSPQRAIEGPIRHPALPAPQDDRVSFADVLPKPGQLPAPEARLALPAPDPAPVVPPADGEQADTGTISPEPVSQPAEEADTAEQSPAEPVPEKTEVPKGDGDPTTEVTAQPGTDKIMARDDAPPGVYGKGEVLTTGTGRQTAPFPDLRMDTPAKARNTLKRVQQWWIREALAEIEGRTDLGEWVARGLNDALTTGNNMAGAANDAADLLVGQLVRGTGKPKNEEPQEKRPGLSSLPGGVSENEDAAQDQWAGKSAVSEARRLAHDLGDAAGIERFTIDMRKPVGDALVGEAKAYVAENEGKKTGAPEPAPAPAPAVDPGPVPIPPGALADPEETGRRWNKLRGPAKGLILRGMGIEGDEATALRDLSWKDIAPDMQTRLIEALDAATAKPGEKIEDFGKGQIHGSRKDAMARAQELMFGSIDDLVEITAKPLSKSWPEPDWAKMVADGVEPEIVRAVAILRNSLPRRPSRSWEVRDWARDAQKAMKAAAAVMSGETAPADAVRAIKEDHKGGFPAHALFEVMADVAPEEIGDFSRVNLSLTATHSFFNPAKNAREWEDAVSVEMPWQQSKRAYRIYKTFPRNSETLQADITSYVRRQFIARRENLAGQRNEGGKALNLEVFSRQERDTESNRPVKVFYIGYAFGGEASRVEVQGEWATYDEAATFLNDNRADLEERAREERAMKGVEWKRPEDMEPRAGGPSWRPGDVTPKMFMETFGLDDAESFAAQFGNSSTQKERQDRLNDTYDALMDLASVLGLPPKALFLGGNLKLSFGARGKGGRNPAAAHYEPGQKVINLTRRSGAGTLAHEWFHALDNFLAGVMRAERNREGVSAWISGDSRPKSDVDESFATASELSELRNGDPKINRIVAAAKELRRALRRKDTDFFKRSQNLDKQRGGEVYFAQTIEMAARTFERAMYDRLAERGMVNDFLVGIDVTAGAHPTAREMRRNGSDAAMIELLAAMQDYNGVTGDTFTADLPPIMQDYGYRGPKVGQTWPGPKNVIRKIVATSERTGVHAGDFLFDLDMGNGRIVTGMTEAEVEEQIDKDEVATSPEMQARRDARKAADDSAQAQRKAAEDKKAAEIAEARAFLEGLGDNSTARQMLRALDGGGSWLSMRGKPNNPIHGAWVMFKEGYRIKGAGRRATVEHMKTGSFWRAKSFTPTFETMMRLLESDAAAKAKAETEMQALPEASDADLNHLFGVHDAGVRPDGEGSGEGAAQDGGAVEAGAEGGETLDAQGDQGQAGPGAAAGEPDAGSASRDDDAVSDGQQPADLTPAPAAPRADDTSSLTLAERDRLAALRDRFRNKIKTQLNSGLDPELVSIAAEMAGIYIKAGARKFRDLVRAMVEDLGLTFATIQPYARGAYNQVRDDMDLEGQDITGMDDARAVMDEIRAIRAEEAAAAEAATVRPQEEDPAPQQQEGADNDGAGNQEPDRGSPAGDAGNDGGADRGSRDLPGEGGDAVDQSDGGADGPDGSASVDGGGVRVSAPAPLTPKKGTNPGNYRLTEADAIGTGTTGERIKANIAAIRIVKALDAENRYPTREEQAAMAKFVGWGGLRGVFDPKNTGKSDQFGRAQAELKEILTTEEYQQALISTSNAHYTAPGVVSAMWRAMAHLGYRGGRALEPTMGVGNFVGFQPEGMAVDTEWHGAELDPITGKIAAALYPEARVMAGEGFQNAAFAHGAFDIAIGNPPFGGETITRGREKDLSGLKIHNYIIAKTGRHLRPGGVMAMVVTHRFLDTNNAEARSRLAQDFRFLGAVRLPNNAFAENANTEVTTDIVFFQKLKAGENPDLEAAWLDTNGDLGGGIRVNRWFAENPDAILGRSALDGTMYGGARGQEYTVHGDGRDLAEAIDKAVTEKMAAAKDALGTRERALEAAVVSETVSNMALGQMMLDQTGAVVVREDDLPGGAPNIVTVTPDSLWKNEAAEYDSLVKALEAVRDNREGEALTESLRALREASQFLYLASGGKAANPTQMQTAIYAMVDAGRGDTSRPYIWGKVAKDALTQAKKMLENRRLGDDGYARVKAMLKLRQDAIALLGMERTVAPGNKELEQARKALKKQYDAFVKKHGFLNSPANQAAMRRDQGFEMALEAAYSPKTDTGPESAVPSALLEKRVNFPFKEATSADTPEDGLMISMSERGRVDIPFIAALTGRTPAEVIDALTSGADPRIFLDPETNAYEEAEGYLSGNVKHKLAIARAEGMEANIKALEAAQPAPLPKERIVPNGRAMWIPADIFRDFLEAMGVTNAKVSVIESAGKIAASGHVGRLTDFGQQFNHPDADPLDLFRSMTSGKTIKVMRGQKEDRHVDETATKEVNALADRMAREFQKWAYLSSDRTQAVVDAYNEKMNTHVERKFNGVKFLKPVGLSPEILPRNSQKNGAWRMIQSPTSLMHHVVGAGKTYTAIIAIMERRRMGLSRKPLVAVPNHLVDQWASDFRKAYPGARVLAAGKEDFEKNNRRRMLSRIATGDYDAIIIGHSQLIKMENSAESTASLIQEQLDMLRDTLEEARRNGTDRRTVDQIAKAVKKYEERLEKLNDKAAERSDALGITFQDMGIDYLAVDEAHEFKNLEYQTGGERLVGMNDPQGSQRAFDLYVKVRSLLDANSKPGVRNGVGFLTGTPISNSLVEAYTIMKYLAAKDMKDRGIAHFDAWSGAYVQAETRFEYNAAQKLVERRVMSRLVNLNSLSQLYREFADVILADQLKEIYREQIEAENVQRAKDGLAPKDTRFPVPKVEGGGRQLFSAPATAPQRLYTDYLASRFLGIKSAPDKREYQSIDNALWILSDARKASIDIRTVDPEQPRDPNSKVARAAERAFNRWKRTSNVRGAQLIFSDLSTPKKEARSAAVRHLAKAYAYVSQAEGKKVLLKVHKDRADAIAAAKGGMADAWADALAGLSNVITDPMTPDALRDEIVKWLDDNQTEAAAAMATFDSGFSVYDDMKAALIEKGIPAKEIAFIHDYDGDKAKAGLFADVRAGNIRFLLGSTQKMGAGTNVQERLVGLHHMDSPWRPSDVEQREGRIIRAGNALYDADPDGFEVEISAYSTEGTSDVVLWQVLERKARAIEQFLSGATDTMEETGGDSDSYAEFMAQSTGNPVFLRKLEAERDLLNAEAEVSGHLAKREEARNFLATYDARKQRAQSVADLLSGMKVATAKLEGTSVTADMADLAPVLTAYREKYQAAEDAYEAEVDKVRAENKALKAEGKKQQILPKFDMESPSPFAPEVLAQSSYARLLKAALEKSKNGPANNRVRVQIDGSDTLTVEILREPTTLDPRKSDYTVTAAVGDGRNGVEQTRFILSSTRVVDPMNSPQLINGLARGSIAGYIERRLDDAARLVARIEEQKPHMEKEAARSVDESKVRNLRALVKFYQADVALAEANQEAARKDAPPNRYVMMDPHPERIFGTETGDLIEEQVNITLREGDPETDGLYEGTGVGSGRDIGVFDAVNAKTGQRIIVRLATKDAIKQSGEYSSTPLIAADDAEATGKWHVVDVMFDPHTGMAAEAGAQLEGRQRRGAAMPVGNEKSEGAEDPDDIHALLTAEMKRMKVSNRVSLRITGKIRGWASFTLGQFFFVGKDAGTIEISGGRSKKTSMATLRHEVVHALRSPEMWGNAPYGLFTREEWSALVRAGRADPAVRAWVKKNYADEDSSGRAEEYAAEFFSRWMEKQDLRKTEILTRALVKLRDMIRAIARVITPMLNLEKPPHKPSVKAEEVARAIANGTIGSRGPDGGGPVISDRLVKMGVSEVVEGNSSLSEMRRKFGDELADRVDRAIRDGLVTEKQAGKFIGGMNPKARLDLPGGGIMETQIGRGVKVSADRVGLLARNAVTQSMAGKYSSLAMVPGRALVNEVGRNIMSLKSYLKAKDAMDTDRNKWVDRTQARADAWRKMAIKNKPANDNLMRLMHESTIWEVDPTKEFVRFASKSQHEIVNEIGLNEDAATNPEQREAQRAVLRDRERRKAYENIKGRFDTLPSDFKALYSTIRDEYADMQADFDAALKDNIGKVTHIAVRRSARKLEKEIREIEEDGDRTPKEKAAAIEEAEARHEKRVSAAKQGQAARNASMRKLFEGNRLKGPYFPLSRFGEFFVTERDDEGNVIRFSRFELAADQQAAAEAARKAGAKVETGVMNEKTSSRGMVDPKFVMEVEGLLAGSGASKELMDDIWQRWLETLPEVSVRKNRIHRKGRAGYADDAFRSFTNNQFHAAYQLARLKNGLEMQDALDEAEREAALSPDPVRAGLLVNEMVRRHETVMNPPGSPWASWVTSAAFVWYLGLTPAAAIVNLTQTTILGIPILSTINKGGAGSGMAEAAAEIAKAGRQFLTGKGFKVENHPDLNAEEKNAILRAYELGVIDRTQAHDLAGMTEEGLRYNPVAAKAMRIVSWGFHHTERMNREVTMLAAYRMARKAGQGVEGAFKTASEATWKTHFSYQASDRPRMMQNDFAKVFLVFRNYQVQMIWRLFRDIHQATKGQDEAVRREARRQLFGITGMMMLHAGVSGTWLFGITMMIAGFFMGGGADEAEAEFKTAVVDLLGPQLGGALWYGSLGQMTGIDLTSRIGMPDLWFRSESRDLEGEDAYNAFLQQTVGAAPGILEGFYRGAEMIGDGNWMRGIETMAPKFARDAIKAYRYGTEGAQTLKGNEILDNVNAADVARQILGFSPAKVSERYEVNSILKNREGRILDRRSKIMGEAARAIIDGQPITEEMMAKIEAFNADFPEYPISPKSLKQSVRSRLSARAKNEFGITINPKLNDRLRAEAPPVVTQG